MWLIDIILLTKTHTHWKEDCWRNGTLMLKHCPHSAQHIKLSIMFALIHKLLSTKKLKTVSSERNSEPSKGISHLGEGHKNLLLLLRSFLLPCEQVTLDQAQKNSTTHTHKRGIFVFLLIEAIRQAIQAHRWFWFCLLCSGMQSPEMLQNIWLCRHNTFTCTEAGAEPGLNPTFPRASRLYLPL